MKPHEETWEMYKEPYGTGARVLIRNQRGTVAHFPSFDPASAIARVPNARLAAAAPEMARALLEVEQAFAEMGWHMDRGVRLRVREALTKAGVLP